MRFILMISFCLRSGQAQGEEGSALNNLSSVAQRAEVHSLDAETTLLKLMRPQISCFDSLFQSADAWIWIQTSQVCSAAGLWVAHAGSACDNIGSLQRETPLARGALDTATAGDLGQALRDTTEDSLWSSWHLEG